MVFTGTYEHTIDAKQRVSIPSEVRSQVRRAEAAHGGDTDPLRLYVVLGDGGALCLYTESGFERRAAELDNSPLEYEELMAYERLLFSLAQPVELDNQGRLRLPESLLRRTQLDRDVVLIGVKDHLEIRDRAAWQAHVEQVLRERPQILMNPRKAMRPPSAPEAPEAPEGK